MADKTNSNKNLGSPTSPTFATHGQLIVGEDSIFLSHLPMFMFRPQSHPHNFQVILKVALSDGNADPQAVYMNDRRKNRDRKIYTVVPEEFDIVNLVSQDPMQVLRSFRGKIFRGHFEHSSGQEIADATFDVEMVVHFHAFDPDARGPNQLEYILFGKERELFLAHYITRPPDFDQVISLESIDHQFSDEELIHGVHIIFPGRANSIPMKIKEGEQISGQARADCSSGSVDLSIKAGTEFYFCAGELAKAM